MFKKLIVLTSFVLVLGIAGNASADLVAHWNFNEASGNVVNDISGNGHDGTIEGAPNWVPGVGGSALDFDGTDDYVDTGKSLLNNLPEFTLALWVNAENYTSNRIGLVGQNDCIEFGFNGGGDLRCWNTAVGGNVTFAYPHSYPSWHHVAAVGTTAGMMLYIDGELVVGPGNTPGADYGSSTFTVKIGGGGIYDDTGNWFLGQIDDVRIYNHALTEQELLDAMEVAGEAWPYAFGPEPADGALHEATWANISWKPGGFAISHDVYLGDNFDDVNAGAEGTFIGNQATTKLIVGFPGFAYPDGLVPGTTYYWRIDEVNDTEPNSPWKGNVWSFMVPPRTAYDPDPSDGVKFIDPDVELSWTAGFGTKLHTVYFGDSFDDVNNAVVGLPQSATIYTPGTLELDKVYYWRVDEFDGTATLKGDVWSFKTQPDIPITEPNLVGWWTLDEGMGTTALDWSGHGNHGTLFGSEWIIPGFLGDAALNFSRGGYVAIQNLSYNSTDNTELTVCAWIRTISESTQYIASFDRDSYWRLEINGSGGGPGQVGWDVMTSSGQVDYGSSTRVDDGLWHHVTGVYDHGRLIIYIDARPEPSASGGNTFGSSNPRFGFIGANSEATSFNGTRGGGSPIFGNIDDLRIYDKALTQEEITLVMRGDPLLAWGPKPSQGSTPYIRDAMPLSWSAGDNASQHDIYFGTDRDAVGDADASDTTGIYRGRQGGTIYTPAEGVEWGGGPYYWRVDEYNTDATISKGGIWSFTVADFIEIDGIEDYNDYPPYEIFSTWVDGYGVATNGSTAGYPEPDFLAGEHYVETTIVHGGSQSMPLLYDNNFKYSEATMTLTQRDWTEEGVGVLSLWFYGDADNAAERMYVALNGSAVVYHGNPNAVLIDEWTEWRIDLQEFAAQGVNLANVNTIAIGFGDKNNLQAGGSGMVFFDDIRLYRPAQ